VIALALTLLLTASPEEAAVLEVLDAQTAAWNRGDLVAFCAPYAEDATFVSPSGVTRGRAQVLERYRKRYPDRKAMGTLRLEPSEVRLQGAALSLVARWSLAYPDRPTASGQTLLVLHHTAAGWRIVQDASM
jgi:uncharacterized protein (TIGR02246 family)